MAAKHDQSRTTNESSTITNTSTSTENIADSYNTTKSVVNNLDNVGNYNIFAGADAGTGTAAAALGIDPNQISGGIDWKKTALIGGVVIGVAILLGWMFRN